MAAADKPTPIEAGSKDAKAKDAALKAAVSQIEREYGAGAVMKLGSKSVMDVEAIPTGAISLDLALGVGGVPKGRIVEIFGPESSGKTTLIYHIIAQCQARGGVCAFVDAEHAIDPVYARRIGVDTDELLISQPDYGEQALEIVDVLTRSGAVDLVAVDSVAALTPRVELEGQMGEVQVGLQARLMSQALRKLAGNLNRAKTVCLFTNQIREKIGVSFGSPETQPGGRALKFYSSQRLDLRRIETLKEGTEAVGNRVRVKVVKNKVAAPFKTCEFDIIYGEGISFEGDVLDIGAAVDIVKKSGTWFGYGDDRLGQGKEQARRFLKEHPEITMDIAMKIRAHFGVDSAPAPNAGAASTSDTAEDADGDAASPSPRGRKSGTSRARP
jgi:recombination protein RecA